MKDLEALFRRDRADGVPEPPDPRYTAAAVRRRLGIGAGGGTGMAWGPSSLWPPVAAAAGSMLVCVLAARALGLNLWWLLAVPASALPLCPILLRKGA